MDNFKDNETDIQHLIISSLEGTASEEELLVLQKWLEESEQHFLLFHAYRQDWIQAGCVQRYQTEEAWKKVEHRLFHRMSVKHLFLWTRIAGYAALVVLMIAVGYVFMRRDQDKDQAYVVEGNIEPGGKKAILVLGSDEKVVLGDEAEETLLAGNTTVKKEGNTLVYGEKHAKETAGEYNRLITPRGGEYAVVLADGTKVWLNSASRLIYPVAFSGNTREVTLEGEAYFDVQRDEMKPFIVTTSLGKVNVLGTRFNVKFYPEEASVITTLVDGSVSFSNEEVIETKLSPGYQLVYDKGDTIVSIRAVNVNNYVGWQDNQLCFHGETLEDIMRVLARWYDVEVIFEDEELKQIEFSGNLDKYEDISKFFKLFELGANVQFVIDNKVICVRKKK